ARQSRRPHRARRRTLGPRRVRRRHGSRRLLHRHRRAAGPHGRRSPDADARRPEVTAAVEVETPTEVEPGVYDNVPSEVYHSDPVPGGSLSSTGARKLATECPAAFKHWLDNPEPSKKEFDFGTAAHKVVLGDGPE